MKVIKVKDKEFNFSNSWEDMTVKQWINFYKMNEKRDKENFVEEFYLLSVLETLCDAEVGELDEMMLEEYNKNIEELKFLLTSPEIPKRKPVLIGDIYYSFKENFNELTTGEFVSIKTLQSKYTNNLDGVPYILAVIFRPVTKSVDSETGLEEWIQEKFDTKNIEWRANMIYNSVKALDVMDGLNFFFLGNKE